MNAAKPSKKNIFIGVGSVVLALLAYLVFEYVSYISTDNAQVEAHSVMLAAKVGGFVTEVMVREGAKVKKGDTLVQIDERDYKNTVQQMKSELGSLLARKADAEKNFQRINELYAKGAVSQQQHDAVGATFSDIKSKFEAVSSQVSQAELNLENTQIKAPMDGFIAKRSVEGGQLANPGVPLIGFVGADERWISANFKETDIGSIRIGAAVDVEIDALAKNYKGVVESISSATGATFALLPPDNATGNFTKVVQRVPVKIKLEALSPDDIEVLRAGLSAFVRVHKH
jgi:membrane fusion protein, multidrug efflux system